MNTAVDLSQEEEIILQERIQESFEVRANTQIQVISLMNYDPKELKSITNWIQEYGKRFEELWDKKGMRDITKIITELRKNPTINTITVL